MTSNEDALYNWYGKQSQDTNLIVKPTTEADLPDIYALSVAEDFSNGLHVLSIYFRTTDHTFWHVIRNANGELVAFDILHLMDSGRMLGFQTMVKDSARKMKVARKFIDLWGGLSHVPMIGNNVGQSMQIEKWVKNGTFTFKVAEFEGIPNYKKLFSAEIDGISTYSASDHVESVISYDRKVLPTENRSKFLAELLKHHDDRMQSFVAFENGAVVGYGTLNRYSDKQEYLFQMCYADSPKIAVSLMQALVKSLKVPEAGFLVTQIPCENQIAYRLMASLGLEPGRAEVRGFFGPHRHANANMDTSRVYGMSDFWPL